MCTVLVLYRWHEAAPLIIAANRDEFYERPTRGPERLVTEPVVAIGGRDLEHGGTWMGLNERGLFAGLTNMPNFETGRRSRGEVVLAALACEARGQVRAWLEAHAPPKRYRPFNLLYGTAEQLEVAYCRDDGLRFESVTPGLHVLPSGGPLDDAALPKSVRARHLLDEAVRPSTPGDAGRGPDGQALGSLVERLFEALSDDWYPAPDQLPEALRKGPLEAELMARLQAVNVRTPSYGTRSSTVVVLGPGERRYYYAEGPPDRATLERHDHLLPS